MRILLLEDSDDDALLIEKVLKRSDPETEIQRVASRSEFLTALNTSAPEIILSDHALPEFSSVVALGLAREVIPFIPFILVTGAASDEFAASVIKQGADDYVLKNNLNRLPTAIRQAIAKKHTEKSLVNSEANLRSLFENTDTAFLLLDTDFNVVSFNHLAAEWTLSALHKELTAGENIFSYSMNGESDRTRGIRTKIRAGSKIEYETQIRQNWYYVRFIPLKKIGQNFGGASLAISNITRRKTLENERLRSSEELERTVLRFQQAQEIAHLGHWQTDFATKQSYWSDEAYRIYGLVPGSETPSEELFFRYIHPDDCERVKLLIRNGMEALKPFSFSHRIVRDDGEIRNLFSVWRFEFNDAARATGLYGISLDVTELTEKEKDLELANNELTTFIYRAYHDLRAPISTIQGLVNVAETELKEGKPLDHFNLVNYFNLINDVAVKQLKMLQNLINIMTIRNREQQNESFEVAPLIDHVLKELRPLPDYKNVEISVKNEIMTTIHCDRTLLSEAVYNLLENAIQYFNRSHPTPHVLLKFSNAIDGNLLIEVEDNGIGMSEKVLGRIFDIFYRATDISKGSGLGLALVKSAIEKLGGSIQVSSSEGVGTVFRITVPQSAPKQV